MLQTLKDLFATLQPPAPGSDGPAAEHALQLATAVMLVEVMRADATFEPSERAAVLAALRDKFDLADDEAQRLAELAEQDGALQHLQQRLGELALPLRTSPVPVAESLQPPGR